MPSEVVTNSRPVAELSKQHLFEVGSCPDRMRQLVITACGGLKTPLLGAEMALEDAIQMCSDSAKAYVKACGGDVSEAHLNVLRRWMTVKIELKKGPENYPEFVAAGNFAEFKKQVSERATVHFLLTAAARFGEAAAAQINNAALGEVPPPDAEDLHYMFCSALEAAKRELNCAAQPELPRWPGAFEMGKRR